MFNVSRRTALVGAAATVVALAAGGTAVAFAQGATDPDPKFPGVVDVTPTVEPVPSLAELQHAADDAVAGADDGSIVCVNGQGGLVGEIAIDRDAGAPPLTLEVKNLSCGQAFSGSHAAN